MHDEFARAFLLWNGYFCRSCRSAWNQGWHVISRRRLLGQAGTGLVVLGAGVPLLSGCGPAAGAAKVWFREFAEMIGAEVAADAVAEGVEWVFGEVWKAWAEPALAMEVEQAKQGYVQASANVYGHMIPGTALVGFSRASGWNAAADRLGCVRASGEQIILDSWVWKSIDMFIRDQLGDKEGDDRLHLLQLLVATVMPHRPGNAGGSPRGTSRWVTYPAKDGDVEVVKSVESGEPKVTLTASGYFAGSPGTPTKRTFDLVWTS